MLGFILGMIVGLIFGMVLMACVVRSGELSRQEEIYYSRIWRDDDEENNC